MKWKMRWLNSYIVTAEAAAAAPPLWDIIESFSIIIRENFIPKQQYLDV